MACQRGLPAADKRQLQIHDRRRGSAPAERAVGHTHCSPAMHISHGYRQPMVQCRAVRTESCREREREKAFRFFMKFAEAKCERIAIENPIGVVSTLYRKPDQIIHPYMFGDPVRKATCLWLKNLPTLVPTDVVEPEIIRTGNYTFSGPAFVARDENGKSLSWSDPLTAKIRSKTYPGIARAFAEQWGGRYEAQATIFDFLEEENNEGN